MIQLDISFASALTWFGVFLTLIGLGLSYLGWKSGDKLERAINDMQKIVSDLEKGAVLQVMEQQERVFSRLTGTISGFSEPVATPVSTTINFDSDKGREEI